jgi:uncharacterized protein
MKILVVAKSPVPGRVKTRLCPPLTLREAADVAEAALADTLDAVAATGASERVLALDGQPGDWLPEGFRVVPQRGTSFAERLAAAWGDCGGPALQIGMDTPQVTTIHLEEALETLADNDSVLGLAPDGGWWALGLHVPAPTAFDGVPMSRRTTSLHQRRRLRELGLHPALLTPLEDVDTWDEAVTVAQVAPDGRFGRLVLDIDRRIEPLPKTSVRELVS